MIPDFFRAVSFGPDAFEIQKWHPCGHLKLERQMPDTLMPNNLMTEKKINKHELRTKETRELLLQSAEKIFVRDGYEGAELGEIAALAGRTKGAIYAQFKSKEDIFLALIDQRTVAYRSQMLEVVARSTGFAPKPRKSRV